MKELYRYFYGLGWFIGKLNFQITMNREFEGFYGIASESWETQFHATCNEIRNSNGFVLIPKIDMVSKRFEDIDKFGERILRIIRSEP